MNVYVLRVVTGKEEHVAKLIRQADKPAIRKIYCLANSYGAPLYAGYIFLEMTDRIDGDTYRPVMEIPFVLSYLCPVSGVHPIGARERQKIGNYYCERVQKGERVVITSGPLKGLEGSLLDIRLPKVTVEMDLYGEIIHYNVGLKHVCFPCLGEGAARDVNCYPAQNKLQEEII